jgi:ABC-2 type transport system permease protein
MIRAIAMHEWRRLRAGMMFWVLLAFGQLTIAWLAFAQLEEFAKIAPQLKARAFLLGVTDLVVVPILIPLVLILLLCAPLLAMGSLAGETHSGRISLWLSSPVSGSQIVLGKILGLWLASLPLVISAILTLAALGLGIDIDWPRFLLAAVCLMLLNLWLGSIALFVSGLFDHPAAALAASYGTLLFLWLLDRLSSPEAPWYWLALRPHVEPWLQGLLRSQDIVFFVATGGAAALLAVYAIARRRGEV